MRIIHSNDLGEELELTYREELSPPQCHGTIGTTLFAKL